MKPLKTNVILFTALTGTVQQVFELGGGGGGGGKEECEKEFFGGTGGHPCGFLFNFSKVTENALITIKLLIFSTSSVMLLSGLKIHLH